MSQNFHLGCLPPWLRFNEQLQTGFFLANSLAYSVLAERLEDTQFEETSFRFDLQTELPIIRFCMPFVVERQIASVSHFCFHLFSWVLSLGFVFFVGEALLLVVF